MEGAVDAGPVGVPGEGSAGAGAEMEGWLRIGLAGAADGAGVVWFAQPKAGEGDAGLAGYGLNDGGEDGGEGTLLGDGEDDGG